FARAVAPFFGIDAAVNPAAAGRRTVIFQIRKAADRFMIGDRVAVDLLENLFGVRLVGDAARPSVGQRLARVAFVIPSQVEQALITRRSRTGLKFFEPFTQVVDEPRAGAAVFGRVNRLVVPLNQSLRVGETAVFL